MLAQEDIARFLGKPSIYPPVRNPFYIVAPPYIRTSAGIRGLHLLCHHLNMLGISAYMVIYPKTLNPALLNPAWITPLLTKEIAAYHYSEGLTPVTIYPETISGNPLNAPVVMRYVMNYPGLLGGDTVYAPDELVYGYSQKLADFVGKPKQVLFMPLSDPRVFSPPEKEGLRSSSAYWAAKYKDFHNGELFPITNDSIEITRGKPDSQSQEEIASLFRKLNIFYAYENTALIIEAILCGCPVVCLPNEHFTELLGVEEIGQDGIAWGDTPEEVARARATVAQARAHYLKLADQYWYQLQAMVNHCSAHAFTVSYSTMIETEYLTQKGKGFYLARYTFDYWKLHGTRAVFSKICALCQRKMLKIKH